MIRAACQHDQCKKFGKHRNGDQRYRCILCGATFTKSGPKPLGDMRISMEEAVAVLKLLLEGVSINATVRITGTTKPTILDLLTFVGKRCERFLRSKLTALPVDDVQVDEIWGFVQCKERTRERLKKSEIYGDCYTFTAIERHTKLLLTWHVGKRCADDTYAFLFKLDRATTGQFQLTADGWKPYGAGVPGILGTRVDFAKLIKTYTTVGGDDQRRFSPPTVASTIKIPFLGNPDESRICTSHVERKNLTMRMQNRRLTRLTNGHSKKWENHEAALGLWFAFYNFARPHMSLKNTTPAMAAGLTDHVWTIEELLTEAAA